MNIAFYVSQSDVEPLKELGIDLTVIQSDRFDGLSDGVIIMLGSTAITLRAIAAIVKVLVQRNNVITMALDGNEYRNIDKETALEIVKKHYDYRIPYGDSNTDKGVESEKA